MDKKHRARYFLAVYLVIAGLAIVLVLVGINYAKDTWQSVVLNLSTELLGVVLIFFLINRLFLIDDWDTSTRIENLFNRLEKHTSLLRGPEDNIPFDELIANSMDIRLLGYSLITVFSRHSAMLAQRVRDGARLRMIIVDPRSTAGQLIQDNSNVKYPEDLIIAHVRNVTDITKDAKSRIEIRSLNWIPSCSLILVDPEQSDAHVRVTIYPPYPLAPVSERAHFILSRQEDKRWYYTFINQFEDLWSQAEPIDLTD